MVKVLSQSGNSLADVYDVVGSVAGIEQLESREVGLVHEMGSTLLAERFSTQIRRATAEGLLQSVNFQVLIDDLPTVPTRLLGVGVFADTGTRISKAAVSVRTILRELPIWVYDAANIDPVRINNEGSVEDVDFLRGIASMDFVPSFIGGTAQPISVSQVALRGTTTAFGAGTVNITVLLYQAFPSVEGLSSRGIPIPSW